MCGRFVDPNLNNTDTEFAQLKINPFPRQRFNVKPTDEVLILSGPEREPMVARWWLIPSWFSGNDPRDWKATTFNARIEDAREKPTFRAAWRYGRCLIPSGGFYEWTGAPGHKQPHFFRLAGNEENLYFAGLLSVWNDLRTCTILTRDANEDMRDIHNRMPVILNAEERDAWLGGAGDLEIGAGARLRHHLVGPFGSADEGPELIEEISPN